jgi:ATP-dependent RNA helicase HelY
VSATEFLGLTPDEFQAEAFGALDEGQSVVVSAPTGAGKTLIAEYAILRALRNGQRAIYTTPIKALSNQKFRELATIAPIEQTGLVTGDNSIRPGAAVVVMTTEVLRNMIYEQPSALDEVAVIVIDEVHFLQDRFRGPVWEEVIVHAPERIQLVCLSATVSNADELGEWIRTLRGPTTTVVRTKRPVRLERWFAVTPKAEAVEIIPLFARKKGDGREPNPQGRRFDPEPTSRRNNRSNSPARKRSKFFTPSRRELIERLDADDMLPAIWFIFSRRGCDEAVGSLRRSGIQMSRVSDRPTISAIIDDHTSHLTAEDLDALGFRSWRGALIDGFASHHAGQIPAFKEATEEAFSRGLLKVVFATETLALGINMPARTVVIDKLTKFEGTVAGPDSRAIHEFLSPAQFTQMTGRAGRRGIDDLGHAVVLWSPWVSFEQAATLAANDNFPLKSAFRPTYNMTANLMKRYPEAQAVSVLRRSFAQFQMDRNLVADAERLRRLIRRSEELTAAAHCERGDVAAALRERSRRSSQGRSEHRGAHGPTRRYWQPCVGCARERYCEAVRSPNRSW